MRGMWAIVGGDRLGLVRMQLEQVLIDGATWTGYLPRKLTVKRQR